MICDKRGISLIEVCISLVVLSVGVLGLIAVQPSAWRQSGRSDYLGRAAGILSHELQTMEAILMNPANNLNIPVNGTREENQEVRVSGQAPGRQIAGDATFNVRTTTTNLGNSYRVTVRVTWPQSATGITESIIVTTQEYFRQ